MQHTNKILKNSNFTLPLEETCFAEVILLDVPCFILNHSIYLFILVVYLFFIYHINKKMETFQPCCSAVISF